MERRPYILVASGSNSHGQLATDSTEDSHSFIRCIFAGCEPGLLPPNTHRVLQLASGANHTLVLLQRDDETRELWGCGDGHNGKLGREFRTKHGTASVFQPIDLPFRTTYAPLGYTCRLIAAAFETSYLVLSSPTRPDVLISMGANYFGSLGIGADETSNGPHIIPIDKILADGYLLDVNDFDLNSLSAGPRHVIMDVRASLRGGSRRSLLIGWGACRHGQLGNEVQTAMAANPQIIPVDISSDPPQSFALGEQHTAILHASGRVTTLGSNRRGQLQDAATWTNIRSIGCTWKGTYLMAERDGNRVVLATGSNSHGQLGQGNCTDSKEPVNLRPVDFPFSDEGRRLRVVVCGSEHILVLTALSAPDVTGDEESAVEVWGWGWNEHGNLGLGNTTDITTPTKIWPSVSDTDYSSSTVVGAWAGCGTSWIALS